MRKLILISAFVLAAASVQAVEARELILAAIHDTPFDVPAAVSRLTSMVDTLCVGPSTASIVEAAIERRILARWDREIGSLPR